MVNFTKILEYKALELTLKGVKKKAQNYFHQFDTTFPIPINVEESPVFNSLPFIDTSCLNEEIPLFKSKASDIKKYTRPLFQKLSKEVHPDSGGFQSGDLFLEIRQAYETDKLGPLLFFALSFNIDIEWEEDIETRLDRELLIIATEIKTLKETLGWVWGEASSEEKKDIEAFVNVVLNPE